MKTSTTKLEANRRNAQRSTGPTSAEGKAASARNALQHGLSSGVLTVLPAEDPAALDRLIAGIRDEFKPATPSENFFCDQMVHAAWKLQRVRRLQAEALDRLAANGDADTDRALLDEIETPGNIVDKLERYEGAAARAYSKAVRDLAQLRANAAKLKKQNEAKPAASRPSWLQAHLANIQNEATAAGETSPEPRVATAATASGTSIPAARGVMI